MKVVLLASLTLASPALAQDAKIGAIDFYGVRTVSLTRLREALLIHEGDSVTTDIMTGLQRLEGVPGVERAALDVVCCENGQPTLYVGIQEHGAPALEFRPSPTGSVRLSETVLASYRSFEAAFDDAIKAGDFAEDDTAGHALMRFPAARRAQEQFVPIARRRRSELAKVLRQSADEQHRAIAAQVLAYLPDKKAVIPELVRATRDPYSTVRNNAVRALAIIAGFARLHPELGLAVPAEPFIDLMNSLVWTDRNKSAMALMQISEAREPALLAVLRAKALPSLAEMARWKAPGHALPAFIILARIAGVPETEIFPAFQTEHREEIIQRASR